MDDKVEALSQLLEQKGEEMENRFFKKFFVRILFLNNKNFPSVRKIFDGGEKYQGDILRIKEYEFPNYGGH